jgi:CDP-paratose 2-epimerase
VLYDRRVPSRVVLVTGGAGFVGSNVAVALRRRHPDWRVLALDNLHRGGAELNLPRLREAGVEFRRGDVRDPDDLDVGLRLDAIVECSAEPSVLAGRDGSPDYLVRTNLFGAYACLERARADGAQVVFLSTSRVYPVEALRALRLRETATRFELEEEQPLAGVSAAGVAETLPLEGTRTLYGATKLAAEHLVAEYGAVYGLPGVVNRCGVIAGPWQFGRVDQGVFAWWALAHLFRRPLAYIGYGGTGKQVRDLLHVADLVELVADQLERPEHWAGAVVNVGGGRAGSLSLRETTELCRELTGNEVPIAAEPEERPGDVPLYLSDCTRLASLTDWRPERGPEQVLRDLVAWAREHAADLEALVS